MTQRRSRPATQSGMRLQTVMLGTWTLLVLWAVPYEAGMGASGDAMAATALLGVGVPPLVGASRWALHRAGIWPGRLVWAWVLTGTSAGRWHAVGLVQRVRPVARGEQDAVQRPGLDPL